MGIQLRGILPGEDLDERFVLLLLVEDRKGLAVFGGEDGPFFASAGLVAVFGTMELSGEVRQGWWRVEVTVEVGAILEGATIVVGSVGVGVFTEGGGDCLVPGVDEGLKVGEDVGGAPFGVSMGTLDVPAGFE